MTTRTNLSQYRKLSNTIQLKGRYSTLQQPRLSQTVKLPALNAINKSIKYNDLSFATSRDLNKLRKQPEGVDDYNEVAAHNILLGIRKKYDNINKVRQNKQDEIEQLQTQRQKYQIQKDKYVDEKNDAQKKVKYLEEKLKDIKYLGQQTEMQKKVMTNMVNRIKHDKIVYDQRKFDLEKEYKSIKKAQDIIIQENIKNHEEEDKTRKVYNKLSEHFAAEEQQRNLSISSLERMLEQKNGLVQYNTMRSQQMKEISQNTLQDKDHKQKNWYKVYLCHRFVQKFLRDKMSRQMHKFNTVQVAYKNIKTQTGVSNTQNLISKFLNKQHIYGDLLGKIADNEKHISELKTMNDDMTRQRTKLQAQNSVLYSNKKDHKDLTAQQKQLMNISQKSMRCKLFYERMKIWLQRNKKKFIKIQNKNKYIQSDDEIKIVQFFKQYVKSMVKNVDEAKDVPPQADSINLNEIVKNKSNFRIQSQQKNETKLETSQTKQQDEDEYVNNQRQSMIRDNQKFMKDLKKKYEQIRKNKIDGQPKKKQVSPQKPKKQ